MPTYRLKYFKGRGRAEVIRMLFAMAEQPFEDIRYTMEEFKATEKANTPFGQMPVLEIDGKPYTQSEGIARYVAKTFGFCGKNDIEMLEIEEVLGIYQDVAQCLMAFHHEKDEARKAEIEKDNKEVKLPFLLGCFEKLLKKNGTGYFVGDSITLADITLFMLSDHVTQVLNADDFPLVAKCRDLVKADPRMKTWLDKREALEKS